MYHESEIKCEISYVRLMIFKDSEIEEYRHPIFTRFTLLVNGC